MAETEIHKERAHARLAPSSSHRWWHCPGSIPMSDGIEQTSSVFADEGTAAHELGSLCLINGQDASRYLGDFININAESRGDLIKKANPSGKLHEVSEEMVDGVQEYIDHVRSLWGDDRDKVEVDIEKRLDMTHIHEGIFGTGDALVFQIEESHLHIVDLKYGKGVVVEVEDNPQLMLYGAGAARRYHNRNPEQVTITIVQPRAPHKDGSVRSVTCDVLDLFQFETEIAEAGKRVDTATLTFKEGPTDEWVGAYLHSGDHCQFCPAEPTCPAYRQDVLTSAMAEFDDEGDVVLPEPSKLTDDQRAQALSATDRIKNWVKAVQEFEHAQALAGNMCPGFKLVNGRATRKWKDEGNLLDDLTLMHGLDDDQIYVEPKPPALKSPPQLEKTLGKKAFAAEFTDLVVKRSSTTNLVPISDPRPAVKLDAASEFTED